MKELSNGGAGRRRFLKRVGLWAVGATAAAAGNISRAASEKNAGNGHHIALPRCRILPLPNREVSFLVNGEEPVRWHAGRQYPRPFFFPFTGPSGASLTRMGHPGAPNHDHHRSVWFAHHDVNGVDFWSDKTRAEVRQKQWLCYVDGEEACVMAVQLGWFSPERELMEQILVAILRPGEKGESFLELQSTFRPLGEPVVLGKTNFGFLAVRVAKSISKHFGGGELRDSEGRVGEPEIFGKRARWMDYSGPIGGGKVEGVTYFDHPENAGYPAHWHVREDGWMGASLCMNEARGIAVGETLHLRYLLHAHGGLAEQEKAARIFSDFSSGVRYEVVESKERHQQFELQPQRPQRKE